MRLTRLFNHWVIGIFFLIFLFCGGCVKQEEKEKNEQRKKTESRESVHYGGIYRVPLMNNPSTLDPAYVQDWYGEAIVHQLFEGLVQFGPYLTVLPALAETWKVEEEGKIYRFFLRRDARFHNGRPVTSRDVVFSICRLLRVTPPPAILPHLLKIDGAQAFREHESNQLKGLQSINDYTLLVRLVEPYVPFLTALGMYQAAIVPEEEVSRSANDFARSPVGSGPFRFVSWTPNQSVRLERFSDYYAGSAFLEEIHYRIYPGVQIDRILSDFQRRELEEMPVYGNIRQELSEKKELQWFHRPSLSLLFYGIRVGHPFLKNPDFRKALSMAIDREKLIEQVYKGQFDPARSILPPGMPAYNRQGKMIVDDFATAKNNFKRALKDEADSVAPIEIVSGSKSAFAQEELKLVKEYWGQLGIPIKIKFITDWSEFETYLKSDTVQIYRYAWFADMPDPDSFLYPLFASDSPVNFTGYENKEVDRMLIAARGIVDPVKRAEMYQQIESLIIESCPIIPLFYLSIDRVYQANVQGVKMSALGPHTMPLHRLWLKTSPIQK